MYKREIKVSPDSRQVTNYYLRMNLRLLSLLVIQTTYYLGIETVPVSLTLDELLTDVINIALSNALTITW